MLHRFAFRSTAATACLLAIVVGIVAQDDAALLRKPIRRLGSNRMRHGSPIQSLLFSADGKKLYAGGGEDPTRAWDAATGKVAQVLEEPWISSIVLPSDGKSMLTAGPFCGYKQWDAESSKLMARLESPPSNIRFAALSHDGSRLALGGSDGALHFYSFADRKLIKTVTPHSEEITALVATDDGHFVSAGGDRSLRWWKPDGEQAQEWIAKTVVHAVLPLANGKCVAAGNDGKLRIHIGAPTKVDSELEAHDKPVVALMRSQDGKRLVSASRDGTALVWDWEQRKVVRRIAAGWDFAEAFALSPDGSKLAAAGRSHRIKLFDTTTGQVVGEPDDGITGPLVHAATIDQGQTWVGLSTDGSMVVWNRGELKPLRRIIVADVGEQQHEFAFAVSAKQNLAFVATSTTPSIQAWDVGEGKVAFQVPVGGDSAVLSLAVSPNGDRLAVGFHSGVAEIWDIAGKKKLHTWKAPAPIQTFAFHPTGKTLAVGSRSAVLLVDTDAGNEIRRLEPRPGVPAKDQPMVSSIAFLPDGRSLIVAGFDGVARQIDLETAKEIQEFEGARSAIASIVPSPDGRMLAAACADRTVRLWEIYGGAKIAVGLGHDGPVAAIDWTADGRTLFSAGADACFLIWDATGIATEGTFPNLAFTLPHLQTRWQELAVVDGARGIRAAWSMVACPEGAAFLAKQLYLVDPERIRKLLAELNDSKFNVRERATADLERYGRWVEAGLREVAENPPGPEAKRRAERLLQKLNVPGALTLQQERLRHRRVVFAFEHIANDAAKKGLSDLSTGAPEEDLRREAAETLARIRGKK